MDKNDFLLWERASRDCIDVKRIYIKVAGDLLGGVMLSQIVFWHLPGPDGNNRKIVDRDGEEWRVVTYDYWCDLLLASRNTVMRRMEKLASRELIIKEVHLNQFGPGPKVHARINWPVFLKALEGAMEEGAEDPVSTKMGLTLVPNWDELVSTKMGLTLLKETNKRVEKRIGFSSREKPSEDQGISVEDPNESTTADEFPAQESVRGRHGKAAKRPRDPLLDHPAVQGYRDIVKMHVPKSQRDLWAVCANETGTDHLLAVVEEWLRRGYSPLNVYGMMQVARRGWGSGQRGGPVPEGELTKFLREREEDAELQGDF